MRFAKQAPTTHEVTARLRQEVQGLVDKVESLPEAPMDLIYAFQRPSGIEVEHAGEMLEHFEPVAGDWARYVMDAHDHVRCLVPSEEFAGTRGGWLIPVAASSRK